jgi:hypothetical protein
VSTYTHNVARRRRSDVELERRGAVDRSAASDLQVAAIKRALDRRARLIDAYNSYAMIRRLPNATLVIYGDVGTPFSFSTRTSSRARSWTSSRGSRRERANTRVPAERLSVIGRPWRRW